LKITFKLLNCTKIILLWQIPNVLPKGSCYGDAGALCTTAHPIQTQCVQSHVQYSFRLVKLWNCQSQSIYVKEGVVKWIKF